MKLKTLTSKTKKYIYFIRWFCGLALLWAFRFAYSSSFWHFFCVFYFVWKGGLYLQSKSQWQRQSQSQSLGIWSWHNNFCHTIEVFANANRKRQTANGKRQTAIALRRQSVKRKAAWKGVSCVSSPTWYPIAMPYRGSYGIANELSSSMAMEEVSLKLGRI